MLMEKRIVFGRKEGRRLKVLLPLECA